jgi:hypothetical protein
MHVVANMGDRLATSKGKRDNQEKHGSVVK